MLVTELLIDGPISAPSTPGPYRIADYLALSDEPRCELIFGRLYMSPAPSALHQVVCAMLFRAIDARAAALGGEALFAPIDVALAEHSVVQPDLVYLSPARRHLVQDRIEGAPDLVIEVLSPGSERRDRGAKTRLYADGGVREYWIVDPVARTFDFLVGADGRFRVALAEDDTYVSATVDGLAIDLVAFWAEVERRAGHA
jgi:Uma2 family endonuclease